MVCGVFVGAGLCAVLLDAGQASEAVNSDNVPSQQKAKQSQPSQQIRFIATSATDSVEQRPFTPCQQGFFFFFSQTVDNKR